MEEQTKETEIRLQDLWTVLKRCWWLMLIVLVVVSLLCYVLLSFTHEDEYSATVSIWALPNAGTNGSNSSSDKTSTSDVSIGTYLVNDYIRMIKNNVMVDKVINSQNLTISPDDLREMISVTNESSTRIIDITVTTASASSAKEVADNWATLFCDYINEELMGGQSMVKIVDYAELPDKPSNPVSLLKILLIGFVCAVLVYGVYFIKFIMDDKINNADDVEKYLGLSMLGVIPNKHESGRKKSKNGYYYSYTSDGGKKRVE